MASHDMPDSIVADNLNLDCAGVVGSKNFRHHFAHLFDEGKPDESGSLITTEQVSDVPIVGPDESDDHSCRPI